ncbi:ATP-binding protein [Fusibacter bizertensis]
MEYFRNILNEYTKDGLIAILSSVGDGILFCDYESNIKFANPKACDILEIKLEDLINLSLNQALQILNDDWSSVNYLYDPELKVVSVSKGLRRNSYIVTGNGNKKYISANFTNIDNEHAKVNGYVLIFRDITRLHTTELQIINEKNKLQKMFEGLPIGMITIDKSLIVYQMNQSFLEILDIQKDAKIGSRFGDLISCENSFKKSCGLSNACNHCQFRNALDDLVELADDAISSTNILTEISYYAENRKKSKWLNLNFMPMREEDQSLYTVTVEDFTERIMNERKLDAARKSSLSILNSLPVMIFKINKYKECDFVNQTFKDTFNVNQDEFIESLKKSMNSDSFELFSRSLAKSVSHESSFNMELQIKNRNDEMRYMIAIGKPYFDVEGKFDGIIGLLLDINEAKIANIKYRQSQSKYYSLYQNMESVIVYFSLEFDQAHHVRNANIVELNKAAHQLFGLNPATLIGEKLMDMFFLSQVEIAKLFELFEKVEREGTGEHIDEFYFSSYDKWLQISIYSPEKNFIAMLITDIDFKKKAQIELMKEKEKSEEANRVKSEFLANMSHEIRTPLNGIVGMIDLTLLEKVSEEQAENLKTAKDCVASLLDIINDVLDFSKIEAGKLKLEKEPFDMKLLLESVIKLHLPKLNEKRLELVVSYEEVANKWYEGDANRIKQVLNNLVNNAIKFTEKGKITLNVNVIQPLNSGAMVVKFVVGDSGIGISDEKKALLFNSFTQIDGTYTRKYGGTGLGLVISKQLVEMMGGTIGFDSMEGVGSNFHFTLPLVTVTGQINYSKLEINQYGDFSNKKILLVEDDIVNQIVMKKMIESEKIKVFVANNGQEAYDLAKMMSFDVILMDIQMPVMDGLEATRCIRNNLNKNTCTPIVALTAFALKGDEVIFRASGMDDYISKPVNRNQLIKLLNTHFEKSIENRKNDTEQADGAFNENHHGDIDWQAIKKNPDEIGNNLERKEILDLLMDRLSQIRLSIDQQNYVLLEIAAHQLKNTFENLHAEELKHISFKMELEIRKENYEKVQEITDRIMTILNLLYEKL